MRRLILMALAVALPGLPVAGMAASNFSGSWVLDNAKSEPVPSLLMLSRVAPDTRGGGGRGGTASEVVITIQMDANSVKVTDATGAVHNYTLGTPLTRRTETGVTQATATASLQGDTLVIATTQPYGGMPGNNTLQANEVYSLSPDGKTLTVITTRTIPAVTKTFKQVYNRK